MDHPQGGWRGRTAVSDPVLEDHQTVERRHRRADERSGYRQHGDEAGSTDRNTEVPRRTLVAALAKESNLVTTQKLRKQLCVVTEVAL